MNFLWLGVALLLIFCSGFGASVLLASPRRPLWPIELFSLSWLLGAAFVSIAQCGLGLLVSGFALQIMVALLCIALAGAALRKVRGRISSFEFPVRWPTRFLLLLICCQAVFLFWLASRQTLGWDGLAFWDLKARAAFLNGGIPRPDYFSDPTRRWSHQDYPLFLPMIESWIYSWIGKCDQSSIRLIFPLFYFAGIGLLGAGAARLGKQTEVGYIAAATLFFLPYLYERNGGILSGYADFPLGVFYLGSVIYLIAYLREGKSSDLRLFLAMSAVMPWIKPEGAILSLCISFLAVQGTFKRLRLRALLLPVPGMVIIGLWWVFRHEMQAGVNPDFPPITGALLMKNLYRCFPIVRAVATELTRYDSWSLMWLGVGCALVQLIYRLAGNAFVIAQAIVGPLILYSSLYVFSSYGSYLAHISLSFPRLLLQIAPTGMLSIALALSTHYERGGSGKEMQERENGGGLMGEASLQRN